MALAAVLQATTDGVEERGVGGTILSGRELKDVVAATVAEEEEAMVVVELAGTEATEVDVSLSVEAVLIHVKLESPRPIKV